MQKVKELTEEEELRLDTQRKSLGEEGLRKRGERLDAAVQENEVVGIVLYKRESLFIVHY